MRLLTFPRRRSWRILSLLSLPAVLATPAHAIILYSSATRNTSAPTGTLSASGWQYEGQFGDVLGTPIAPHYFITAKHVGGADNKLVYNGQTFYTTTPYDDPN